MVESDLIVELYKFIDEEKAVFLPRFFKTGEGQYGAGDIFLGITVPNTRIVAKKFLNIDLQELKVYLKSKYHEVRLCALIILVEKFKLEKNNPKEIYDFYLDNLEGINNWDLVDLSVYKIVGEYLVNRDKSERQVLYDFARSDDLWKRRIAIVSTFAFIRNNDFSTTIDISQILLNDKEDLIHKATGWMLREMGKKSKTELIDFLQKYSTKMPRTMLRYSIEKFDESERRYWMRIEK